MNTPDYVLLDAARMKRNFDLFQEMGYHYECLYEDRSRDDLASVAPYLVGASSGTGLLQWIKNNGLGDAWGVFISSQASFEILLEHFRKFVIRTKPGMGEFYFRFYDPRVLKRFLSSANAKECMDFFGPAEAFVTEGDTTKTLNLFTQQGGKIRQDTIAAEQYLVG